MTSRRLEHVLLMLKKRLLELGIMQCHILLSVTMMIKSNFHGPKVSDAGS